MTQLNYFYQPMDYLAKIEHIIQVLRSNDATDEANLIADTRSAAFMGSELLMSVTHELLALIKHDARLLALVGKDVNELKIYCHSIGLMVW